ncbi:MAG TPA: hypothetical protein VLI39_06845 [Sedimentisphaerales bacterium]|nr:hypothetical protein [Sedimentisphaerales bacterium]
MIGSLLKDLERRIDPQVEEELLQQWKAFADGRPGDEVFSPKRRRASPPGVEWPHVLVNDALEDPQAMVVQQLEMCSKSLAEGSGALPAVRCNYGTAILPSLFGAEIFLMDREIDTLPACRPLEGGVDAVKRLLDRGVPDLESGQGGLVFRMGEHFMRLFQEYPNLSQYVHVYHPDLQGPLNVCEMLWGGPLYVDFYDKPDLIKDFLSLIVETYIRFMRRWDEVVPRRSSLGPTRRQAIPRDEGRTTSDARTRSTGRCSMAAGSWCATTPRRISRPPCTTSSFDCMTSDCSLSWGAGRFTSADEAIILSRRSLA